MVKNDSWGGNRRGSQTQKGGKLELDQSDKLDLLNKKLSKITLGGPSSSTYQVNAFSCDICGGTNHDTSYCGGLSPEHVAAMGYRNEWQGGPRMGQGDS